jgi:type IV secretory pathway TraG/TraD family ATPase VirD4
MTDTETRRLSAWLVFLAPLIAWVAAVHKLMSLQQWHKIRGLYDAALATPHQPILWAALLGGLVVGIACARMLQSGRSRFSGAPFEKFLRGTRIVSARKLCQLTNDRKRAQVSLAGIPIPVAAENLHLLIAGGTGSGKSTLFRELALGATLRRDRMICLDPNGDMLAKFWQAGDVVLNPYDARTEGWSFFNEIRSTQDFARYVYSIVPEAKTGDGEEWAGYGRLLLQETARKLHVIGQPSVRELFRLTTIAPPDELQEFLKGTMAESLFIGNASKALASARFILSNKLPEHVNMPEGSFSLRRWLEDPEAGNLWITWREDMKQALKPLISAWVDALFVSVLSMPENPDRRIWAFIDELASLDKLDTLEDALTKGRKHGLRVVAGLQSTSQLNDIYGRDKAQTLRSCFSSFAVLRISKSDPATAEEFSKALGEHEVERQRESTTTGSRSNSTGKQLVLERERVVTPAELTAMPDLTGYIALVGDRPIARFATAYHKFENKVPAFVEREEVG